VIDCVSIPVKKQLRFHSQGRILGEI